MNRGDLSIGSHERVAIEDVAPAVDAGRFEIKRVVGEPVVVECDAFVDGHDLITVVVQDRPQGTAEWRETPMDDLGNDRWRGTFTVGTVGRHEYTALAWIDRFGSWSRDLAKKVDAGQDVHVELLLGAPLVAAAAGRARAEGLEEDAERLGDVSDALEADGDVDMRVALALAPDLAASMDRFPDRAGATRASVLVIVVDRPLAGFSAWYELFPRSCGPDDRTHGTFADAERRLPYVADMGFDVVYLPPIHPIGHAHRKGPNNALTTEPGDVGSPWAIGSEEGGHTAVHPGLGTLDDFRHFLGRAEELGLEVALDVAFQVSPDHPWVKEHPDWFRRRPGGTFQYAENPPKKYEDILPINFESAASERLWEALKGVFDFWIAEGVRVFRVDNPHTKPYRFWEWCITEIKRAHPEVLFLAEAFTRPKVMHHLAKLGFSQSYTYFAWRNTKWELGEYLTELTQSDSREWFRPNVWPNTPDILTELLQYGGRTAFLARVVLAATLCANYGIYGPAFELCEGRPREPGSEEYLDSEKYQLRDWDLDAPHSLREIIATLNRMRRAHAALQQNRTLRFHHVDNDQLLCYSKSLADPPDHGSARSGSESRDDAILCVVNLDPWHSQSGWTHLDLGALSLSDGPFQVHDLLSGDHYLWQGPHNFVRLDPHVLPAHVFVVQRHVRTEENFLYYE